MLENASGPMALPNAVMPWRHMYCPVKSVAWLTIQIDVVTRACSNRTPSLASWSMRGVFTVRLPAAPIESDRMSSITRSSTFSLCAGALGHGRRR